MSQPAKEASADAQDRVDGETIAELRSMMNTLRLENESLRSHVSAMSPSSAPQSSIVADNVKLRSSLQRALYTQQQELEMLRPESDQTNGIPL